MPRRKSDATEGEAALPAVEPGADPAAGPGESEDARPVLSTPDEAAEPGAPDTGPAPAADAVDPIDPLGPRPDDPSVDAIEDIEHREPEADPVDPIDFSDPADPLGPLPDDPAGDPIEETGRHDAIDDIDYDPQIDEPAVPDATPRLDPPASASETADDAHDEDEGGSSLAAKLLTGLVLLLAGGGLALWGAPKVAPHLPSGMSGVAGWLTPGADAVDARIASLESGLGSRLDAMDAKLGEAVTAADVDSRVSSAVDGAAARLDGEIASLKQSVADAGTGDLPQQIARVQSLVDGQVAELDTLKQQLSGTAAPTGQIGEEALARIDVYRAELDGLRTEVGTLQDRVAGLATKLDESTQRADREIETARTKVAAIETESETRLTNAQASADVAQIRAALEGGVPFEAPLAALQGQSGVAVPPGLAAAAAAGVEPMVRLRDDFPDSAHAAIRASMMAGAGEGVLARTKAFFGAQVASRSLTPQPGNSPDAVLSRAEDRLRQDDLNGALAELGNLPPEAQAEMGDWLAAARLRAGAVDGLAELEATLPAATAN